MSNTEQLFQTACRMKIWVLKRLADYSRRTLLLTAYRFLFRLLYNFLE